MWVKGTDTRLGEFFGCLFGQCCLPGKYAEISSCVRSRKRNDYGHRGSTIRTGGSVLTFVAGNVAVMEALALRKKGMKSSRGAQALYLLSVRRLESTGQNRANAKTGDASVITLILPHSLFTFFCTNPVFSHLRGIDSPQNKFCLKMK